MASSSKSIQEYLVSLGFKPSVNVLYQQTPEELHRESLDRNLAEETEGGVLCVRTGKFTGRSPKDRFIVKDDLTSEKVDWGAINKPFDAAKFDKLFDKAVNFLSDKDVFVRDVRACAEKKYSISVRTVCQYPWSSLFIRNMFIALTDEELNSMDDPDWLIVDAPEFEADPSVDGTLSKNFAIVSFTRKIILVGGTGYTGEMKKGIFSVLNFTLPSFHSVLPMHCSANVGKDGDTALFFGLSGTGKTTLSADPSRFLIGDDEHGWSEDGKVFNFEGGCYAKVIDLSVEKEPDIFNAIKPGAILENIVFKKGTKEVDFADGSITENTRVSYPIDFIEKIKMPSVGGDPKNIFFLTCDAFGVLPPVSQLDANQAAFHFISGYTAKVAGTEVGITEPTSSFSSCFGAPFMPLPPTVYADMLIDKVKKTGAKVWLVNTGWVAGSAGAGGYRIDLASTRAIITAILNGDLDNVEYAKDEFFGLNYPKTCPGVDPKLLNPCKVWDSEEAYVAKAKSLAVKFYDNFKSYADKASKEIVQGGPIYGKS